MFGGRAAAAEERVDFVEEDNAGGEAAGDSEDGSDVLLVLAVPGGEGRVECVSVIAHTLSYTHSEREKERKRTAGPRTICS